jgi:putative ABC transport system permease protein
VRPANAIHLYRVRLRARALQELFAVLGIAAGVALLFASQVASQSLQSSVSSLNAGIVGHATLQLSARDTHGFPEAILASVRRISGVRVAAPLVEVNANAVGPSSSSSLKLVGADETLTQLGGALVRRAALTPFNGLGAVVLPSPLAKRLGVTQFGQPLSLQIGGATTEAQLYAQLGAAQIGGLVNSPVAIAPLSYAQELAGLQGRVSRILIEPAPGAQASVRAALDTLAAGRLNVAGADYQPRLFAKAAAATNQSTALFAVISALVGFLFAFNATLLTVPQRRRLIADLRRDGYTPRAVIALLLLDALALGALACALGLLLGDELSLHLFGSTPGYLASAFALGSQRVLGWQCWAIAIAGGLGAATVAVLSPLRDILSRDPLAAITTSERPASAPRSRLALAGLVCLAATLVVLFAVPKLAVLGMVTLIAALLLLLPIPLYAALALVSRLAPHITSAIPHVAAMELRSGRARAVAISATGALAVFGSVAIQGAHGDLLHGLEAAAHDENAFTDVWVAPAGTYNLLTTAPFPERQAGATIGHLPGVRAVRVYRGGLLDYGERRVWVIAPPPDASPLLPPSQIVQGNVAQATRRVREGGWVVLSEALAEERHLRVGDAFTLPSPVPLRFRVAALSTNVGWAPGAIVLGAEDYARAWGSTDAAAYNVLLEPGFPQRRAADEIQHALGPASGLSAQPAEDRAAQQRALSRQGLERLSQIATLILIAAVLAMAAAMGSMIWQRRPRLAKLKLEGFSPSELWGTILLESVILLGVGCATGALVGLLGQQLLDRALAQVINYPVVASLGLAPALASLGLVTAAAVAILALPGYLAARVPAAVALQD